MQSTIHSSGKHVSAQIIENETAVGRFGMNHAINVGCESHGAQRVRGRQATGLTAA
jgi:hypothetical protein